MPSRDYGADVAGVKIEAIRRESKLPDRLQIETSLKSFQNTIFIQLYELGVQIADFWNAIDERSAPVIIVIYYCLSIFFILAGCLEKLGFNLEVRQLCMTIERPLLVF